MEEIKLTQFSHGAGCGCKIAPQVLDEILKSNFTMPDNKNLLVGNHSKDDAAAYDLGDGTALISTTDFFMPIVDDAFDFGRIASANAISDVFAMGGKPILAIAILGWPIDKLSSAVAQRVIEGSRSICAEAGIPLAGGHSIDSKEPIFGLAVSGLVDIKNLKKNNSAKAGDLLFITKRFRSWYTVNCAEKDVLKPEHLQLMVKQMTTLNKVGEALGKINGVHAMTDVTGFGLLGHLIEMAEGSNCSASINYSKILLADGVKEYAAQQIFPGGTKRNWNSYGHKVEAVEKSIEAEAMITLPDPQTNGGLLISVDPKAQDEVIHVFKQFGLDKFITPIGTVTEAKEKVVYVNND